MKKYFSLEFLRFLSSFSVLMYHYRHFFLPANILSNESYDNHQINLPFFNFFDFLYEYGFYGVHIFYTISGFVFAHVYLELKDNTSFKEFSVNRFARLYPLHFATLLIVAVFQLLFLINYGDFQFDYINDIYHFFLQVFFISSWGFEDGHSFNAPIWSVSVEIGIYLIFFLLIKFFKKYGLNFCISLTIFLIIIDKFEIYESLFLECARLFFSGVLVFYIIKYKIRSLVIFSLSLFLIIIAFLGNFKTFIFCPGLILLFLSFENLITQEKIKNIFMTLGNWTYALYLLHVPFQLILIFSLQGYFNILNIFSDSVFFFIYFASLFLISHLVFILYERPLNKKIRGKFLN